MKLHSHSQQLIEGINKKARELRKCIIRMIAKAKSGHPGGSLSAIDIVTCLYYHQLRIDPKNPQWDARDRFVLSKGHGCPALYVALADLGYFPKEELSTLRQVGSRLQGHPDMNKTPGVDMTSGSLGQGLSVGLGMALGARIQKKNYYTYVLLGDGEIDEGQVWESAMAAAHFKVDNLTAILDLNGLQLDGPTDEIMALGDVTGKWKAFGWHVIEINGHEIDEILSALDDAREIRGKPTIIVAKTVKGKGVSFMENEYKWHGNPITEELMHSALSELEGR